MNVPVMIDMIQSDKQLEIPEIRVWCHPHAINETGDDYYEVFDNFREAMEFVQEHGEAEKQPLIAFRGYEINIFDIRRYEE